MKAALLAALVCLAAPGPAHASPCARHAVVAASAVVGLAAGGEDSLDVAIRDGLERAGAARYAGPKVRAEHLAVGVSAYAVAIAARGDLRYLSRASLALAVSLGSVVALKTLTGREPAYVERSAGAWRGPSWPPRGWPSGHVATVGAVLLTAAELSGETWARAAAWLGTIAMGASALAHEQHFASDVVASLALSAYVSRWAAGRQCRDRVELVPAPGGVGVAWGWS